MRATEYDELDRELSDLDGKGTSVTTASPSGIKVIPLVVSVVSLIVFSGIVWYAYSKGVREGSETAAPVLRPDNPAKQAPEDRGGREIAGQNLNVYNRVSGGNASQTKVERILPPPEEPVLPPKTKETAESQTAPTAETDISQQPEVPDPAPVSNPAPAPVEAATQSPPSTVTTGTSRIQEEAAKVLQQGTKQPEASDPKLTAPVTPPPTANNETQQTAAAAVSAAPPASTRPDSKVLTGWRIQIAALKSEQAARNEWAKRQKTNPTLLGSLALEIQNAKVKGTNYYRVRGGPLKDANSAKALCGKLKSAGLACIPVAPGK